MTRLNRDVDFVTQDYATEQGASKREVRPQLLRWHRYSSMDDKARCLLLLEQRPVEYTMPNGIRLRLRFASFTQEPIWH
jgi:hypothetical protein